MQVFLEEVHMHMTTLYSEESDMFEKSVSFAGER